MWKHIVVMRMICMLGSVGVCLNARANEVTLLTVPVEITADVKTDGDNVYKAQIGVHNGPITQLVGTTLHANNAAAIDGVLRKQVQWREPYLFVHAGCESGSGWRCDGEVVFKVANGKVTRLGDLIGNKPTDVLRSGHFYDYYDKLEQQVGGLPHAASMGFIVVLDDMDAVLKVNAEATWSGNTALWHERAAKITALQPKTDWLDADWEPYFSAIVGNAALARYCNKAEQLQQLLSATDSTLDAEHRRLLADAVSKVVPLEAPKAWRAPY